MCRCHSLKDVQNHAFRRWQREFREQVQPMLDEREKLIEENHELREQVARLEGQRSKTAQRVTA